MATPSKKSNYRVLVGRVEARVGKKEIAAEAGAPNGGDRIELSDEAAASLVERGIVEVTTSPAPSAPVRAPVKPVDGTGAKMADGGGGDGKPAEGAGGETKPAEGVASAIAAGGTPAGAAK